MADVNVACRTTLDILNDLLCFDKMESGILILHKHEVPAVQFISDCVGMFSAQAREGDVSISVVYGDRGCCGDPLLVDDLSCPCLLNSDTVFIDRFKIDQVIRNLISNALKFTPRGGSVTVSANFVPSPPDMLDQFQGSYFRSDKNRRRSSSNFFRSSIGADSALRRKSSTQVFIESDIEAASEQKVSEASSSVPAAVMKGNLVIVVNDTGAGMLEENYTRLFKEIIQFNPEVLQAGGGSGLGLWITKGIVDLHDGKVSVHSEGLGLGSSFTVELPMTRKQPRKSSLPTFPEESHAFSEYTPQEGSIAAVQEGDVSVWSSVKSLTDS